MRVKFVCVRDIAEAENVELLLAITSCSVDRKQDGPGDATSDQADDDRYLQISEQEVAIQRVMLENESVRELIKGFQPSDERIR